MTRNELRLLVKQAGQMTWQRGLRLGLLWSAALLLGWLTWMALLNLRQAALPLLPWITLSIVPAALALLLTSGLEYLPLSRSWQYRLAFLFSASLPGGYPITAWLFHLPGPLPFQTWALAQGLTLCAAFSGSLLATWMNQGLWENNSPPSAHVQEVVYQLHRQRIGAGQAVPRGKRIFDCLLAGGGLLFFAPVWLVSLVVIWLEDPGPLLFVKNSVGKGGVNFHQFKLRTMIRSAEEHTGPVLAQESDRRVLRCGRLLRKTALDELPQLLNILLGEMSFVGPRPQRTVLVYEYLQHMPEYAERHQVLPGLAGLAQVAGDYYLTPRQKLRFDRLYLHASSVGFDLKLLFLAGLTTFWLRWQKNWNGRLPRHWLHPGSMPRQLPPQNR